MNYAKCVKAGIDYKPALLAYELSDVEYICNEDDPKQLALIIVKVSEK